MIISERVIDDVLSKLPERLEDPKNWRGERADNDYSNIEGLVYDFGKYKIVLRRRASKETATYGKIYVGSSTLVYVLRGSMELFVYNQRKDKRARFSSNLFLKKDCWFYLPNNSASVIIPRSREVFTLSIVVWNKRFEGKFKKSEELSTERTQELVEIFREFFPASASKPDVNLNAGT